jgi:hypothetical protein
MFTSFLGQSGGAVMVLCGIELRGTCCNHLQVQSDLVHYNIRLCRE